MKPEHSDPVWEILGRGRQVSVRSGFARELAGLARQTPQDGGAVEDLPRRRRRGNVVSFFSAHPWQSGLAAAAAVAVLAAVGLRDATPPQGAGIASAPASSGIAADAVAEIPAGAPSAEALEASTAATPTEGSDLLALMFDRPADAVDQGDVPPALPELESALTELENVNSLLAVEDPEMLEEIDDGLLAALLF